HHLVAAGGDGDRRAGAHHRGDVGDRPHLKGADVDAFGDRARVAEEVGGRRVGGGTGVNRRAVRQEPEVARLKVLDLGVDHGHAGAALRAEAVRDVVREDRAGAARVKVRRRVVEADVVADDRVVGGPDAPAGHGDHVVDDLPAGGPGLRVRLNAVVLALVDHVVGDPGVDGRRARVDAVDELLVTGLPQPDVVDQVAVDQDVGGVPVRVDVDPGTALPAGVPGEELADRVDVVTDDLDVARVDQDAVAQTRLRVAGDLEVLETDVAVVDLDGRLRRGVVVALDRGAPLGLSPKRDEVAGRATLGGDDVALVDAVRDED